MSKTKKTGPRVLLFDLETAPIKALLWGMYDQNLSLNQIEEDWTILSFAAMWLDEGKMMYNSVEGQRNLRKDKHMLQDLWKLLDEADIVVTQNGKKFDSKKANARFAIHDFKPPSTYLHFDTLRESKKYFGFTSHSLESLCKILKTEHQKLKHSNFPGMELWRECLNKNPLAWKEMKLYNENDVLCLRDVYNKIHPWSANSSINFALFNEGKEDHFLCKCGSTESLKYGYAFTKTAKYQRIKCKICGNESRERKNLLVVKK